MGKNILSRRFHELIEAGCEDDPSLLARQKKTRAIFEAYAFSKGLTPNTLLLIHVCDSYGNVRRTLEHYVTKTYQLSVGSRPGYLSDIKYMVKSVTGIHVGINNDGTRCLLNKDIPEYMEPMLLHVARKNAQGNLTREERLKRSYSSTGEYLILASLEVHESFNIQSLESLFVEHYGDLSKALRDVSRKRKVVARSFVYHIRKRLGFEFPKHISGSVPVEKMLEPFRTEVETYRSRAISLGDEKSSQDRREREIFIEKAARYGLTPKYLSTFTVKSAIQGLCKLYGELLPLIQEKNLTSFSTKDLLRITREMEEVDDEQVPRDFNFFVDIIREEERQKSNRFKRRGFDTGKFENCIGYIKSVAVFNGYFRLLDPFSKAYSKITKDKERIEERKQKKKDLFSINYIDHHIKRLRKRFDRIINTRSFVRRNGRIADADYDLKLCLFYVNLVVLRYLSYRQQCLRVCTYGVNIVFAPDGSIILSWNEKEVKNKKPIRVMLTPDRYEGAWEPVLHALHTYNNKLYPYILKCCRNQGSLAELEGQFFVYMSIDGGFSRFEEDDEAGFWSHFTSAAHTYEVIPQEAIDQDIHLNPHHLRGLCMDWMYEIGMTAEEISTATGDTIEVIRAKYFNKKAVQDATRAFANTDRRLREEQRKVIDVDAVLKEREVVHATELAQRDANVAELKQVIEHLRSELAQERSLKAAG